ncbi:MAG: P-loop NTPase [Candidatus Hydrogenedentes bacterium]|nr:P-loop NTPase [Candidatus Hydrogenedentota bacterium]
MNQDTRPSLVTASLETGTPPAGWPVFDFKRFVVLRGRMIAVTTLFLAIPTVVAAWLFVPVGYTASADIRLLSAEPFVLEKPEDDTPYATYVNTQISIVTGNAVLSDVLKSPTVRDLPLLSSQDDPLEYLKGCVSAHISRGGEIITITCSMPEKEAARITLEQIVSVYMNYSITLVASMSDERLAWLTRERDARQVELDMQLEKIATLEKTLGIPVVGETPLETGEPQLYNESLIRAEEDLVKAQRSQAELQNQMTLAEALTDNVSKGLPAYDFGLEERVSADSRVSALRGEVVMAQARLAGASDIERENLPTRKIDEKRLASLRDNLQTVERDVRKEVLQSFQAQQSREFDSLTKEVEEAQQRVSKYKQLLDEYKGRVEKTTEQYAQLKDLESKVAETRSILDEVRSNIASIKVESNAPTRVQLVAPPSVPGGGPDYLPRIVGMLMAGAASLGVGVSLGVWRELTDQQLRSSQDLARLTDLPVVATIPHADEDSVPDKVAIPLVTERLPLSTLADAYRRVLAQFLHPDRGSVRDMGSLLVVSPTRGDGKTSLTCNLGVALAQAGRRVLLVDLSYRHPKLEKSFGLPEAEGLAEILSRCRAPNELLRQTHVPGLYVLGPGQDKDDLAGRLASREMSNFLVKALEEVDHVILDSPPWLIMADARLVALLVSSVLVVVGSGVSSLGMVARCLRELREIDAKVIGVVLNGARLTVGGYMKKNYELYHSYGEEMPSEMDRATPLIRRKAGSAGHESAR